MTKPISTMLLVLTAGVLPAHAGDARELASRLRAETADYEAAWSRSSPAPMEMTASALLQFRYMVDFRNNPSPFDDDRLDTIGFSIPRAQVRLDANIANSQLLAHISFDMGDAEGRRGRGRLDDGDSGTPQLREAWAQYNFGGEQSGYYLKAGQFRSLLLHEEAVRPEFQLAVERTVTNEFFAPGNTQGVALGFVGPHIAWEVSFNDGIKFLGNREPANTEFNSPFEADYAVTARVDWKLAGDWSRFEDFTSWRGDEVAARIGAGLHWQRQGDTNPGSAQPDFLFGETLDITNITWTVDAAYESDGWHAFIAYMGHRLEWEYPVSTLIFTQHGIVLQAGVFLADHIEVFARYDSIYLDSTIVDGFGGSEEWYQFLTAGMNWYILPRSHAAKFTFDVTTALSNSDILDIGVNNSIFFPDPTVTGLLGGTGEEWIMRAQFQILF